MTEKQKDVDAMLDRLREGKGPEDVIGAGGLLEDLTKRLLERALEGELTDHLGYGKHDAGVKKQRQLPRLFKRQLPGSSKAIGKISTRPRSRPGLIAAVNGLTGLPDAIESVFPKTQVQLCIVHMERGSLKSVSWKERKAVAWDLRKIYQAPTVEVAETALMAFKDRRDEHASR